MPYHTPLMTDEEYHQSVHLLGPWLIGLAIEFVLYGILLSQFWTYFTFYKDDRLWMKWVVAGLFVIQLLHTVHAFATCWIQFVLFFTDLQGAIFISYTQWWQSAFVLIDASCGLYVQTYFIYRLYVICHRWWVVAVIAAILCFSYVSIIIATKLIMAAKFNLIARWFAAHYSGVLASDILIAAFTAYFLLTKTKKAVMPQTHTMVISLTKLALQCAVPAAIVAALNLAFSQIYDGTVDLTSTVFNMVLVRVYAISMMFVLNSRKSIVSASATNTWNNSNSRTDRYTNNAGESVHKNRRNPNDDFELGVHVQTETFQHSEITFQTAQAVSQMNIKNDPHSDHEFSKEDSIQEKRPVF